MVKRKWKFVDIPDQTGKIIIVTGANSGLGFESSKALARKGAQVIMACRNMDKANAARDKILAEYPESSLEIIQLDLADLKSIKEFVEKFTEKYKQLDILINNAGVMMVSKGKTVDGFETHLGINHFGHFALTGLLINLLSETSNSRVVTMSSIVHYAGTMNFKNLNWEKRYNKTLAYGRSKLANLYFAYELDRKLKAADKSIISVAAHPGWTRTELQRHSKFYSALNPIMSMKPEKGALCVLYAATGQDIEGGEYVGPRGLIGLRGYPKKARSSIKSHNKKKAQKLWEISEESTNVKFSL